MAKKQQSGSRSKGTKPKRNPSGKTYEFSLSLSGMISAIGAGILVLTFFFVMGILIGRGYRPESDVPQLQEIMPTKEHGQLTAAQNKTEILKAEELDYPERLKERPEAVMAEPSPTPKEEKKPEPRQKREQKPETKPLPQASPAPAPDQSSEKIYNYTYQVASFKKQEMAEALCAKLDNAGLRTAIVSGEVKGVTWYRVHVRHHGSPASINGVKSTLANFGIKKPLLMRKKATH